VRCRAVAVGATIYLLLQDSASTNAVVEAYAYAAGAVTGPTTLVTLDAQADSWDASPWPGTTAGRWFFVWYDSSSTTVTVRRMNALVGEADNTFTPAGAPRISCHANTNYAWVGTVDDTSQTALCRVYNFSGGLMVFFSGPTTAWTFTAASEDSSPPIFGNGANLTTANYVGWVLPTSGAPAVYNFKAGSYTTGGANAIRDFYGGYPVTNPFGVTGEYCWADALANLYPTAFSGTTSPAPRRPVMLRRLGSGGGQVLFPELTAKRSATYIDDTARVDRWTRPAQRPNGNWVVPLAVWIPDDSTGSIYYEFLEFEAPCVTTRMTALAAGALIAPGQPVDLTPQGKVAGVEVGVITAPSIVYIESFNGGGTLADGTYFFAACWRWIDDAGRERRSAPSPVASVAVSGGAGTGTITIYVTRINWSRSERNSQYGQLEIYVSATDESALYLLSDDYPAQAQIGTSTGYIQYSNLTFDPATITANRELYTDGGVQQNDMPPSCRCVVAAEETLWAGVTWDRTLWQESKPIFPEEPAQFTDSDAFKVRFPEDTVAGAYMDGTLIVGSERAIYAVRGQGPNDRGEGAPRTPYCVVSGLGMVNERAVQVTPIGCFFESHRGIELLPRGLGPPVFIGEAVQDQLALRPTILDATFHVGDDSSSVRFLIKDPTGTNAGTRTLVYDIDAQAWSVDTHPVALAALGSTPDGLLFAGANLAASPALLLEDSSSSTDDGSFFEGRLTFHNCYPAGFTGQTKFQACVARTTLNANPSGVNVKVTLDDDSTRAKTITKTGTDTSTVKLYQCDPGNFDNRCAAVTVELYDSAGGVTWYGATIYHEAEPEMGIPLAPAERG
jgi:hypothetical protein